MRVLLIATYELGHQPLNLASAAAHLAQAGCDVSCLDLSVQPFDDALLREADLAAFSTPMHTALQLALRAAERVRRLNPRCQVCFYGLYAGLHAQQLLGRGIDFVVGGEFERGLVQLAHALQNGTPAAAAGVISQTHGGGIYLGRQSFLLPTRDLLPPLERYAHLLHDGRQSQVGYVEASRGCAHRCLHCPITPVYRGKLRVIPREIVQADIEQLVESGAEHITFGDPDFLNAVKHSVAVVDEMHRRHPTLTFDFTAKIEHLLEHKDLLSQFRKQGCLFITSAVEVLNDEILAHLDKGHTAADVEVALRLTRTAGIALRPSFIPFTPWTTLEDYQQLFRFIDRHELHDQVAPIQLTIRLLLPPGSSLLQDPRVQQSIVRFDERTVLYEWRHPDPDIDALYAQVSRTLTQGTTKGWHDQQLYEQLRQVAFPASVTETVGFSPSCGHNGRTPRLTEDWFC